MHTVPHGALAQFSFSNNEKGFADFLSWAEQKSERGPVLHITMEATGVYYEGLAYYLNEKGCPVHAVLPSQTKPEPQIHPVRQ
ncbi:MAG: IS110 family transposase [Tannerella sp.]|nr:IS110 family transposase [Tannerella sp.]